MAIPCVLDRNLEHLFVPFLFPCAQSFCPMNFFCQIHLLDSFFFYLSYKGFGNDPVNSAHSTPCFMVMDTHPAHMYLA